MAAFGACALDGGGTRPEPASRPPPEDDEDPPLDGKAPERDAAPMDAGRMPPQIRDAGRDAKAGPTDASEPDLPSPDEPAPVEDAGPADSSMEEPSGVDAGDPPVVAVDSGSDGCNWDTTLAAEVLFDVNWSATTLGGLVPVLQAGQGQIRVVVRLDLRGGGSTRMRSLVTACGARMPDFAASWLIGEVYAAHFPEESWDKPTMPRWDLGWEFACLEPGCQLGSDAILATIGARAAAADVWPGRTGPISQIVPVDHDDDGQPGYTLISRNSRERDPSGKPYSEIPVHWSLGLRAANASVAFQLSGMFAGDILDCDTLEGDVTSGRLEARAVSCLARPNENAPETVCTDEQTSFLDQNLPNWSVQGGRFRAYRVPSDSDCAAVRAVMDER